MSSLRDSAAAAPTAMAAEDDESLSTWTDVVDGDKEETMVSSTPRVAAVDDASNTIMAAETLWALRHPYCVTIRETIAVTDITDQRLGPPTASRADEGAGGQRRCRCRPVTRPPQRHHARAPRCSILLRCRTSSGSARRNGVCVVSGGRRKHQRRRVVAPGYEDRR